MSEISSVGKPHHPSALSGVQRARQAAESTASSPARGLDSVQLSDVAKALSRIKELPDVREDLVRDVQAKIARGTYETDEKIDAIVDKVYDDLP